MAPAKWPMAWDYKVRHVPIQWTMWTDNSRFVVNPAGRRSGKTFLWKRKGVIRAFMDRDFLGNCYLFCAPTHLQAKRIFWNDIKALIPRSLIKDKSESELYIKLVNDVVIYVAGMDAPHRIEGINRLKGVVMDEYGNMKESVWPENIRPMLSETGGWAACIGVPEGRNHYWHMYNAAQTPKRRARGWRTFTWPSSIILPPEEIEAAKEELDALTFRQEYEADFVEFRGRAYYNFHRDIHAVERLEYDPKLPLVIGADFNKNPGVAAYMQEQRYNGHNPNVRTPFTAVIGEVWIVPDSNSEKVCAQIIEDFHPEYGRIGKHRGFVYLYGDSSGGSGGSAKIMGSDWDIFERMLRPVFGPKLHHNYPRDNPNERPRVNAMNSRIQSTSGGIRFLVDPVNAPHTVDDFEGTRTVDDGSGKLLKKGPGSDPMLTHLSDGCGYYVVEEFPTLIEEAGAVEAI